MTEEQENQLVYIATQRAMQEIPMSHAMQIVGKFLHDSAKDMISKMPEEEKQKFLEEINSKNGRSD